MQLEPEGAQHLRVLIVLGTSVFPMPPLEALFICFVAVWATVRGASYIVRDTHRAKTM